MEHPRPQDKDASIMWARRVLQSKSKFIILDTETTGLKRNDVIIQIGIIDLDGNVLLDSLVKPTKRKRISTEALAIHGITMEHLKDQPSLGELSDKIAKITKDKTVLIYNAEYDEKMFDRTCEQDGIRYIYFRTDCVMEQYSKYVGKWSEYHYGYTFQRLPASDHSAIGDCKATLKVIEKMANTDLINPIVPQQKTERKWWEFWK